MAGEGTIAGGSDTTFVDGQAVARVGDLVDVPGAGGGGASQLDELSDVADVNYGTGYVLAADGVDHYRSSNFPTLNRINLAVATGASPLVVASITKVANLHADSSVQTVLVSADTIDDFLKDVIRDSVLETITVTDEDDLNIQWSAGKIFIGGTIVNTTARGTNYALDDNAISYLYATVAGGSTLIVGASVPADAVQVAKIWTYDGDIEYFIQAKQLHDCTPTLISHVSDVHAAMIVNGCVCTVDAEGTNPNDFTVSTGSYYLGICSKLTIGSILYSAGVGHGENFTRRYFHTATVWDTEFSNGVDFGYWDNGTNKETVSVNNWYVGWIFLEGDGDIEYVYPQTEHASATAALLESLTYPPAHEGCVVPIAKFVFRGSESAFHPDKAFFIDIRPFHGGGVGGGLLQSSWATITGDSGTTSADDPLDSLAIAGGEGLVSSVAGDTVTLDMAVNALAADTLAPSDELLFYDITGTHHNKITLANLEGTLNHENLAGLVENEHIDWTASVGNQLSATISGGSNPSTRLVTTTSGTTIMYEGLSLVQRNIVTGAGGGFGPSLDFRVDDTVINETIVAEIGGIVGADTDNCELVFFVRGGASLTRVARLTGDGEFFLGANDTMNATLHLYGDTTGTNYGGKASFYVCADHDGTIESLNIDAYEDDLRIYPDTAAWTHYFRAAGGVELAGSLGVVGVATVAALVGERATYPVIEGIRTSADTNQVYSIARLTHKTSNDMVDGFGASLVFQATDSGASNQILGSVGAKRDGADTEGALIFTCGTAGAEVFMTLDHAGQLILARNIALAGATSTFGRIDFPNNWYMYHRTADSATQLRIGRGGSGPAGNVILLDEMVNITGGLNVGTATGAGAGDMFASGNVEVVGAGEFGAELYVNYGTGSRVRVDDKAIMQYTSWGGYNILASNLYYDGSGDPHTNIRYLTAAERAAAIFIGGNQALIRFYTVPIASTGAGDLATIQEEMRIAEEMVTCQFDLTVDGGLNVGTATGAGAGDMFASGNVEVDGGAVKVGLNSTVRGYIRLWDGGGGNTPGYVQFGSSDGTVWYLFVEDDGTLKIHNAIPSQNSDGSEVGGQS